MFKCKCRLCKRFARVRRIMAKLSKSDAKFIDWLADALLNLEAEAEMQMYADKEKKA